MSDSKKLKKLKEIRRKDLEKNLLDIELKGYDHYILLMTATKLKLFQSRAVGFQNTFVRQF